MIGIGRRIVAGLAIAGTIELARELGRRAERDGFRSLLPPQRVPRADARKTSADLLRDSRSVAPSLPSNGTYRQKLLKP